VTHAHSLVIPEYGIKGSTKGDGALGGESCGRGGGVGGVVVGDGAYSR
jgi:hypothetical protein